MENEQMKAVLNEVLENQLVLNRTQTETLAAVHQIKTRLDDFESILKAKAENTQAIDDKTIQNAVNKGMAETKLLLQMHSTKPASDNMRVFLESDAKKWAVILVLAITFLTYLYWFLIHVKTNVKI